MNYEDLTFDYLKDLAINNIEEFRKIPIEHIGSVRYLPKIKKGQITFEGILHI